MAAEDNCDAIIGCGLACLIFASFIFFLPGLALFLTSESTKYHSVTYIQKLVDNDTYIMGLQCLESQIKDFILSCKIQNFQHTIVEPCVQFSKSKYGIYQFQCTNQEYLSQRYRDQGGKYHKRIMAKYVVGILCLSLGGFIMVLYCLGVCVCVGAYKCRDVD